MNKKNAIISAVLSMALAFTCIGPMGSASAETKVVKGAVDKALTVTIDTDVPSVRSNGVLVNFPDAKPFIDNNGRTMIPVRFATEQLGATVNWDASTCTAAISKGGIEVDVQIDNDTLTVKKNGTTSTVKMDTTAILKGGRTYVPIRFIAESLGAWVGYSDTYNTVELSLGTLTAADITRLQKYYDMDFAEYCKSKGEYEQAVAYGYDVTPDLTVLKAYGGSNGFVNAMESMYRTANESYYDIQNYLDTSTGNVLWAFEDNASEKISNMLVKNIDSIVTPYFTYGGDAKVSVKTSPALIYHSKYENEIYIRAVITVALANDYSVSDSRCITTLGTPVAGKTYTFDGDIIILDNKNGEPYTACIRNLETQKYDTSDSALCS